MQVNLLIDVSNINCVFHPAFISSKLDHFASIFHLFVFSIFIPQAGERGVIYWDTQRPLHWVDGSGKKKH